MGIKIKSKIKRINDPPRYEDIQLIKIINNTNNFFRNKQGDIKRMIFVLIFAFMFYSLFLSVLPSENVLCFVSAANECTGNDGDIGTTECTAYGGCNGGPAWSIGGEVDTTTCCGDDSNNHVNTESSSTDAPAGYNDGITACCDTSTDCNYNDGCTATTGTSSESIPSKAYCLSETWYGGDASSDACTAITGNASDWISTGTGSTNNCCGDDDTTEDFESTSGSGNKLCYNDNVVFDTAISGSILNSNGEMFDCGGQASDDSGLATHIDVGSCTLYEGYYCGDSAIWTITKPTGCTCTDESGCVIYYNPTFTGTFEINLTAEDNESDISNISFPNTVSSGYIDQSTPYNITYNWETDDTYSDNASLVCYAYSGLTDLIGVNITIDITPASGGYVIYQNDTENVNSLDVLFSYGTDVGSGINSSTAKLYKRNSTLSKGSCLSYGSWEQIGSDEPSSPYSDAAIKLGYCYQYSYEIFDNVMNGINFTGTNESKINTLPLIVNLTLLPTTAGASDDIYCNVTGVDAENDTLHFEYFWYNNSVLALNGNTSDQSNGTNIIVSKLGSGNTSGSEIWNCTVRVYDNYSYSLYNSTTIDIDNSIPTHITPTIIPSSPHVSQNLTCVWNSVSDSDGDDLVNITNWYKNNVSTTLLYMPFEGNGNEANNATDYSGYGNNGTVIGATWNRTGGKIGGGYEFDGEENYILATSNTLKILNNFTILFWAKTDETLSEESNAWFSGVGNDNEDFGIGWQGWSDGWSVEFYNSSYDRLVTDSVDIYVNVDTWYHIAGVYDGSYLRLYVNGTEISSTNVGSHSNIATDQGVIIGGYRNVYWNGSIDEVRIYNHTLSPEQIWANYQAGLAGKSSNQISLNETSLDDEWYCQVTINDGYIDSTTLNSSSVTIINNAPNKPTLITPTEGNFTGHDRSTFFDWNSTDIDGTNLTYYLNITFDSTLACGADIFTTIENNISNYTANYDFCVDEMIYWQVRAFDGIENSSWSDLWNFTIESFISLNLTNNTIDFGSINILESKNTDDDILTPFILENNGNVLVNISSIGANGSLFSTFGLNTIYFQFKADNTSTEDDAFNVTDSTTSWTNMTDVDVANISIIKYLDYNDTKDNAEIDIKVTIPSDESPGSKKATIYIIGEQS
jgi:hypothetical protein